VIKLVCVNEISAIVFAEEKIKNDSDAIIKNVEWKGKPWLDWSSIRKIEAITTIPYKKPNCSKECEAENCKKCLTVTIKRVVYFGPKATFFDRIFSNIRKSYPDIVFGMKDYIICISF
jgi:hypothetical protein